MSDPHSNQPISEPCTGLSKESDRNVQIENMGDCEKQKAAEEEVEQKNKKGEDNEPEDTNQSEDNLPQGTRTAGQDNRGDKILDEKEKEDEQQNEQGGSQEQRDKRENNDENPGKENVTDGHPDEENVTDQYPGNKETTDNHPDKEKVTDERPDKEKATDQYTDKKKATDEQPDEQKVSDKQQSKTKVADKRLVKKKITEQHEKNKVTSEQQEKKKFTDEDPNKEKVSDEHPDKMKCSNRQDMKERDDVQQYKKESTTEQQDKTECADKQIEKKERNDGEQDKTKEESFDIGQVPDLPKGYSGEVGQATAFAANRDRNQDSQTESECVHKAAEDDAGQDEPDSYDATDTTFIKTLDSFQSGQVFKGKQDSQEDHGCQMPETQPVRKLIKIGKQMLAREWQEGETVSVLTGNENRRTGRRQKEYALNQGKENLYHTTNEKATESEETKKCTENPDRISRKRKSENTVSSDRQQSFKLGCGIESYEKQIHAKALKLPQTVYSFNPNHTDAAAAYSYFSSPLDLCMKRKQASEDKVAVRHSPNQRNPVEDPDKIEVCPFPGITKRPTIQEDSDRSDYEFDEVKAIIESVKENTKSSLRRRGELEKQVSPRAKRKATKRRDLSSVADTISKHTTQQVLAATNKNRCARNTKVWEALKACPSLGAVAASSDLDRCHRDGLDTLYCFVELAFNAGLGILDIILGRAAVNWLDTLLAKQVPRILNSSKSATVTRVYGKVMTKLSWFLRHFFLGKWILQVTSLGSMTAGKMMSAVERVYYFLGMTGTNKAKTRWERLREEGLIRLFLRVGFFPIWVHVYMWVVLMTLINSAIMYSRDYSVKTVWKQRADRAMQMRQERERAVKKQHRISAETQQHFENTEYRGEGRGDEVRGRDGSASGRHLDGGYGERRDSGGDAEGAEAGYSQNTYERRRRLLERKEDGQHEERTAVSSEEMATEQSSGEVTYEEDTSSKEEYSYIVTDLDSTVERTPLSERKMIIFSNKDGRVVSRAELKNAGKERVQDPDNQNMNEEAVSMTRQAEEEKTPRYYQILKPAVEGFDRSQDLTDRVISASERNVSFQSQIRTTQSKQKGSPIDQDFYNKPDSNTRDRNKAKFKPARGMSRPVDYEDERMVQSWDLGGSSLSVPSRRHKKPEEEGGVKMESRADLSFAGRSASRTPESITREQRRDLGSEAIANRMISPVKRRLRSLRKKTSPTRFKLHVPPAEPYLLRFSDLSLGNQLVCLLRKVSDVPYLEDVLRDPRDPPPISYDLGAPILIENNQTRRLLDLAASQRIRTDVKRKLSEVYSEDNYNSEEDPDYEPEELDTTDPLEYTEDGADEVSLTEAEDLVDHEVMVEVEIHNSSSVHESDKENCSEQLNLNLGGVLVHWRSIRATPHEFGPSHEGDSKLMPASPRMIPMRQQGSEAHATTR